MNLQYKADVTKYQKRDALIAIGFWAALMALYAVAGSVGSLFGVPLIAVVTVILPVAVLAIVFSNGNGLSSLGIRAKNLWPSLGLGLLCGGVAILTNNGVIPALVYGWPLMPFDYLLTRLLYYLAAIALVEELIFRGYIQTRLYGLFKKDVPAVAFGALLFALMHIPYQVASGRMAFDAFSIIVTLGSTFLWHIAFNLVFVRYYSIFGVMLFHALMDWSNDLFIANSAPFWANFLFFGIAASALAILGIRCLCSRRRS